MIKIKYTRPQYNFRTYFGGPIFVLLGVSYFFTEQTLKWNHYAYVFLGICVTSLLVFDKRTYYLIIDEEKLVVNNFWPITIYLADIVDYQLADGKLKIYKKRGEVTVKLDLINKESQEQFISFLNGIKTAVNH